MTDIYIAGTSVLEDENVFRKMYDSVPPVRQNKIDRYKFDRDKRLSLGAWLLLEKALRIAGISDEIIVDYRSANKPYLAKHPEIFFNLSHSGNMVMCSVSDVEVGCDVERMDSANLKLADRYFSANEARQINSSDVPEEMFFRLWTLKESFIKAVGLGMELPLSSFSIQITEDDIRVSQSAFTDKTFYFKQFQKDDYVYACCAEKPEFSEVKVIGLL